MKRGKLTCKSHNTIPINSFTAKCNVPRCARFAGIVL